MKIKTFITLAVALCAAAVSQTFGGTANLTWTDNSSVEDGFRIERAPTLTPAATDWQEIGTVGASVTTYIDATVVELSSYSYRVRAYKNTTPTTTFSAYSNAATITIPLAAPSGLNSQPAKVATMTLTPGSSITVQNSTSPAGAKKLTIAPGMVLAVYASN